MHANLTRAALAAAAILLAPAAALAHTGVDAHGQGAFETGFIHPIFGLDHLLAMLAVGLWAATIGGRAVLVLCLAFPAAMVVGALIGLSGIPLPGLETGIAASVLALGLAVTLALRPPLPVAAAVTAVFALLHGFAHGAELPPGMDALSYGLGFVLATAILHVLGAGLGRFAMHARARAARLGLRGAGAAIAAAGILFLVD